MSETFYCSECLKERPISEKGKAEKNGKPYNACEQCCHEEQKKQFYSEL